MREVTNDGGAAFPTLDDAGSGLGLREWGLTKRDQFAIAALQSGEASNWRNNEYSPVHGLSIIENTALCAYQFADAMLRARDGGAT